MPRKRQSYPATNTHSVFPAKRAGGGKSTAPAFPPTSRSALDTHTLFAYHAAMKSKDFNRRDFVKAAGLAGLAGATASTVRAANPTKAAAEGAPKHPVVHFEIGCRDLAATKDFYQKLFGWPINDQFEIAGAELSGHLTSLGHDPQHYTIFYVQVDDVADAIAKAESLGGKKLVGPITIPTGTFAWIMDTQENTIGLWKPK